MGVSKWFSPENGWFTMENPIKIHDLGEPLFLETPIYPPRSLTASENPWKMMALEDKEPFLLGRYCNFSGAFPVKLREGNGTATRHPSIFSGV